MDLKFSFGKSLGVVQRSTALMQVLYKRHGLRSNETCAFKPEDSRRNELQRSNTLLSKEKVNETIEASKMSGIMNRLGRSRFVRAFSSTHHLHTYEHIMSHPMNLNIKPTAVFHMIESLGGRIEHLRGGRSKAWLNGIETTFDAHHSKALNKDQVAHIRKFLKEASIDRASFGHFHSAKSESLAPAGAATSEDKDT